MALAMVDRVIPPDASPAPDLVTIFFGANDAASNARQHVPIEEFERNIRAIVRRISERVRHVVVIAPPPVDSTRWPDRSCGAARAYGHAAARAAATEGASFFDAYSELGGNDGSSSWLSCLNDGLHLNAEGNARLSRALLTHVARHHSTLAPDTLPRDFPHHSVPDVADPASAWTPEALAKLHATPCPAAGPTAGI